MPARNSLLGADDRENSGWKAMQDEGFNCARKAGFAASFPSTPATGFWFPAAATREKHTKIEFCFLFELFIFFVFWVHPRPPV
jgi:hypothetical protein